jgi:reactive intermediate/imine deaminase
MTPRTHPVPALLIAALLAAPQLASPANIEKFADGPLAGQNFPFSDSVRVGDILFLSGQIGMTADGKLAAGGIKPEANQALLNITDSLKLRGLTMSNVVKCTVFLADIAEWADFNEVYKQHFSKPYPARSALGSNGLAANARVEIECIAAYP